MRTTRILCLLILWAGVATAADSNRILLRVNDRISTLYDYETRRDDRMRAIQSADLAPAERAELIEGVGIEVLTNMLEEMLVLSRADQLDYHPSLEEVERAVARARENFGIDSEEQFEQALMANGMTRDAFRRQIEVNMRVSGVLGREVQQRIELSEEDLRRYYYDHEDEVTTPERIRLSEIVVLEESGRSPEQRAELAAEIQAALVSGSTMAELAERFQSEGATSGAVDLGWVEHGDLDAGLEDAVWGLEAGQVSEPVSGRGGLHVLVVEERQAAELMPFSEVSANIESIERQRLFAQEYDGFMRELREAAYISVKDLPEDAQGFDIGQSASRLVFETDADELLGKDAEVETSSKKDDDG